ncbi:hypothetical protein J7K55_01345 [Candidatus Aerophobetes bacterium]|nr:hypothetical protein [Candidatus Aerophobetes bacterium]
MWVNWIHYDRKSRERADRYHLKPFRVDFLYQGFTITGDFKRTIVEVDNIWHIAEFKRDVEESLRSQRASLEKFTEHLRRDRWLRKRGWEVCRFSDLEAKKEDQMYLFYEMQGEPHQIPPTYLPHKE